MRSPQKRWRLLPQDEQGAKLLGQKLGLSRVAGQLLLNRKLGDEALARGHLHPELNDLHDPCLHPQMETAARRLRLAVERGEKVVVYGDYDVDGISATAILMRCLRLLKADADFYIPDRLEEGYGLNAAAIEKIAASGAKLLVTVDCGISAVREVELARKLGMDVIITDHHEPGDLVPADALLINPKLPGCPYPFRDLSGAGLAFKLAWAVGKSFSAGARVTPEFRDFLLDSVALAALGTIADVVPLRSENRTLAYFGLRGLSASTAAGLSALRDCAGADGRALNGFDVAFKLAPRLNAAGRMGSARQAVELLMTDSAERAGEIVEHLNRENGRRQRAQEKILEEACAMIEAEGGVKDRASIVLAREGWHPGVVGIVAARIVELYWRPAILLSVEGGIGHGSARSIGPVHLFEALRCCSGRLISYGGHARAAGLRLAVGEIDSFRREFEQCAAAAIGGEELFPELLLDTEVSLSEISRPVIDQIEQLAPFGEGNPEPMLCARDVALSAGVRTMGETGRHISFWVNQDGAAFRAVAFGKGEWADRLNAARTCSIAFVPRLNLWKGEQKVELDVRDIQVG